MEFVNCILCNSKDRFKTIEIVSDRFDLSNQYNITQCNCGMIMLNPRPDKLEIKSYYKDQDYQPHYNTRMNFINIL